MVKVRWLNLPESENCWVDYYELKKKYPEIVANLSLEVKAFLMGEEWLNWRKGVKSTVYLLRIN